LTPPARFVRRILFISLSFDHRVVDGAVGAAFTNALLRRLQAPAALLLPPL
jgi:pyruvate/2-oxoglutarate dehydrogenase complex dihydrolipoamide acyltransferase (E2) component